MNESIAVHLDALPERKYDALWCIGDLVDYPKRKVSADAAKLLGSTLLLFMIFTYISAHFLLLINFIYQPRTKSNWTTKRLPPTLTA